MTPRKKNVPNSKLLIVESGVNAKTHIKAIFSIISDVAIPRLLS
jgi:hypothetical protein